MCCESGNGSYKITVDGSLKGASPSGSSNWATRVHKFTISSGYTSGSVNTSNSGGNSNLPVSPRFDLSDRDTEWLVAHNSRRKKYHEANGKSYIPLKWSNALTQESERWAQKLINDSCGGLKHGELFIRHSVCKISSLFHLLTIRTVFRRLKYQIQTMPTERTLQRKSSCFLCCFIVHIMYRNLRDSLRFPYRNYGTGSYGMLKPADEILERWTEKEFDKIWPQNAHMTQVLWRASTHVGCAEASKPRNGGGTCRIQVCRYARPGEYDLCCVDTYIMNYLRVRD